MLDDRTLALPDRRGNQRADTFHNVLACDSVALAAVVPGCDDLLHIDGTASLTDEPGLLATMAVGGKPPKVALLVRVRRAEIRPNDAIRESRLWSPAAHVDRTQIPDLMRLAAHHLAGNRGTGATVARALSKAPGALLRRGFAASYRRQLRDEGY
jgi:predicted pyridoxine 5'-phosphate oxidase superfamily flavin-nucleotide-binding protein